MQLRNPFRKKPQLPKTLNIYGEFGEVIGTVNEADIQVLAAMVAKKTTKEQQGDGNATFLEPMTDEEYARWVHEHEHGWKAVYDKMLGRSTNENGDE